MKWVLLQPAATQPRVEAVYCVRPANQRPLFLKHTARQSPKRESVTSREHCTRLSRTRLPRLALPPLSLLPPPRPIEPPPNAPRSLPMIAVAHPVYRLPTAPAVKWLATQERNLSKELPYTDSATEAPEDYVLRTYLQFLWLPQVRLSCTSVRYSRTNCMDAHGAATERGRVPLTPRRFSVARVSASVASRECDVGSMQFVLCCTT